MSKAAQSLKPAWLRRHLELAQALLPVGAAMTLTVEGKLLAELGESAALTPATPGAQLFPIALEGQTIGQLLLATAQSSTAQSVSALGELLRHSLESMLSAHHARHCVAQETLESYREMALMQRAVSELNHSLKPAAVAAALLKEFTAGKDASGFGAVFLNGEDGSSTLIECFGEDATNCFTALQATPLFQEIGARTLGDIINRLDEHPAWSTSQLPFQALLWLPLVAHDERLGLLVLASASADNFTAASMKRAQTLVSVAAAALRNAQLYAAEQKMFQAFVRVIATAIDAKSPYTAGHCRRVPEIALLIAEKAHRATKGTPAEFKFDEDERNALEIAALLHDCGKVVTPEWVVDKATKLDSITNRLELVAMRFETLRRDALIERYRALATGIAEERAEQTYRDSLASLDEDFALLEKCNRGGEFLDQDSIERLHAIAGKRWRNHRGEELPLLSDNELYNLSTPRGTLNPEERKIIEDHAVHTIRMLSQIPFPRSLHNVAEYAAGHHERIDGRGYPRGLKGEELSIPARIMAIADIFEALTAPDRPYRKGGKLSWAIEVMYRMKRDRHIDGGLFDLFLSEGVYLDYASRHLATEQLDGVDIHRYLG